MYKKVNLGVSKMIYVNLDSPNLGFPYFNFSSSLFFFFFFGGGGQLKKEPCIYKITGIGI